MEGEMVYIDTIRRTYLFEGVRDKREISLRIIIMDYYIV